MFIIGGIAYHGPVVNGEDARRKGRRRRVLRRRGRQPIEALDAGLESVELFSLTTLEYSRLNSCALWQLSQAWKEAAGPAGLE